MSLSVDLFNRVHVGYSNCWTQANLLCLSHESIPQNGCVFANIWGPSISSVFRDCVFKMAARQGVWATKHLNKQYCCHCFSNHRILLYTFWNKSEFEVLFDLFDIITFRNCIGQNFAMIVTKTTLALLLRRYRLYLDEETPEPKMFAKLTLKSENGIHIKLERLWNWKFAEYFNAGRDFRMAISSVLSLCSWAKQFSYTALFHISSVKSMFSLTERNQMAVTLLCDCFAKLIVLQKSWHLNVSATAQIVASLWLCNASACQCWMGPNVLTGGEQQH